VLYRDGLQTTGMASKRETAENAAGTEDMIASAQPACFRKR